MKSGRLSRSPRFRQTGVSLITAIFLLLLLSILAAGMLSIVSTSHTNMAADIGGSRAYQAARAGAEWGMFQLDPNAENAALPSCVSGTPAIPDHRVVVVCQSWDASEGGRQIRIFRITSRAVPESGKAPGIERVVEVTLEKCRDPGIASPPYDC
ncbi:MAG: hypothetical protein ACK4FP_05610 [Azonexus sp.]